MNNNIIIIVVAAVAIVTVAYLALGSGVFANMLSVQYYNSNRQPIGLFAIIGGAEGVAYVSFTTTVTNTGDLPLTMTIDSAEPSQLSAAYSGKGSRVINSGETAQWISDQIDIQPFVDSTQQFDVTVLGEYDYAGQTNSMTKDAVIVLTVTDDPSPGFIVDIEVDVGDPPGGVEDPPCLTTGTTCNPLMSECCNDCVEESTFSDVFLDSGSCLGAIISCDAGNENSCVIYVYDGSGNLVDTRNVPIGQVNSCGISIGTYELWTSATITTHTCN